MQKDNKDVLSIELLYNWTENHKYSGNKLSSDKAKKTHNKPTVNNDPIIKGRLHICGSK